VQTLGIVQEDIADVVTQQHQHSNPMVAEQVGKQNQAHSDNVVKQHDVVVLERLVNEDMDKYATNIERQLQHVVCLLV
jgi:hypothetical protein